RIILLAGQRVPAYGLYQEAGIQPVWPHAAGGTRGFAVATEQKDESSLAVRSKQAQQFDWALAKLDSSVRRTGRITKTLLQRIFHDICRTGYPSGNQALLLLRSCGSLLPEIPLAERSELAHRIWDKLLELGASYDVSHYNALLKVYLQNEFKFSPTDFLAKMEAAKVLPNRVTYQRLIAAYCQNGDIEGASTILGFMKSKDLPITEAVFNSLVTGHSRAGDIESAKNILSVMRGAGIEPGPDTYVSLLSAYAEKGDMDSLKKTLETLESTDCSLMDRDIMQVIFALAKSGHQEHVPEMVERMRHEKGYVPDAMNLCLSLITQGQEDTAFHILKTFPALQADSLSTDSPSLGNFFLRHCVNINTPLEKIGRYCRELQESNLHASPLQFTLSCALEARKTGMSFELMKMLKEQNLPVRPHYSWPLLTQHVKDKNTAGVLEVVKGMQELGVSPDVETYTSYIFPAFSSTDAATKVSLSVSPSHLFLFSLLCFPVSAPSFPSMDLSVFRGSLILESASYFLYNVMDSMTETEVQAQEDKLRKYFTLLKDQNVTISVNIYRGIRNLLDSYHVPELIKMGMYIYLSDVHLSDTCLSLLWPIEDKVMVLEKKLAELKELKEKNEPIGPVLKQAIVLLCAEENLERALELKQQYEEEMTAGGYATLINLCCRHDSVEEALNLKRELSRKDSSVALDANKYIALVKALSKHGRVEEAVEMLKEMREKEVVVNDANVTTLFHMLNALAVKGNAPTIRRLQDTIFTLGLAKPTANLCSPLITAYLDSKDLPGALEAAIECQKCYNQLPRIHDILVGLVENGDTEMLQKAMDFVSQERGEMTMLYDLFFAFMQTGRYREARKIIETPGLRARPGRLQWYAEKCIASNQMEALEQMVDITAKLFECDRDEMYSYILRLCKHTNDWQKADAVWTKMQEENIIPRERTLRMLAEILKNNGQEVPFEVPEVKIRGCNIYISVILISCQILLFIDLLFVMLSAEAYGLLKDADKKGVALGPSPYDHVIRALLAEGALEDAMVVRDIYTPTRLFPYSLATHFTHLFLSSPDGLAVLKSMLQVDQVPMPLAITKLVQALGSHGDVAGIQEVESQMKGLGTPLNLSSMLFINNMALAHIKNDDVESAVELLETVYTSPGSTGPSMSFVFRRILEDNNDKAIDKLSAMAEQLVNHFACYRPASDLFLQLVDMDKVEDAKFMLARCNAVAEQKEVLVSYMSRKAQSPGQVGKIKTLLSLIPDFAAKEVVYPYLMKCHAIDKDLSSAKALYNVMLQEGVAVDELSLKRLAVLYREAGETAPFPEPPVMVITSHFFSAYCTKL
uniref:Leucine rich pentatricopeptide repeat containing n=1 Tax=Myripristis murdjan TaxID=586833 RepID=A0A667YIG4_9TELE